MKIDLTGMVFERLTVLSFAGSRASNGHLLWNCRCCCGSEVVVVGKQLRRGQTKSCGCLMIERTRAANRRHGMKGTRIYRIWNGMMNRCLNVNDKRSYPRYGGAGITVCERWRIFANFYADMGEPPTVDHSLDRYPNYRGNYEPGNCRWATSKEQGRNRKDNVRVTIDGETRVVAEWAEVSGVSRLRIAERLNGGWEPREAVFTPPDQRFARYPSQPTDVIGGDE